MVEPGLELGANKAWQGVSVGHVVDFRRSCDVLSLAIPFPRNNRLSPGGVHWTARVVDVLGMLKKRFLFVQDGL